MLQLLISWKHITHTYDKKTNYSYCVGALGAFLSLPASCHPPETRCLLSSDYALFLPPIINPSFRPAPPRSLSLCIFPSLLSASRFSASFQPGFKQLCETSKCPSLCRLFRKADNDKPNPADLQLIALFHQPSPVILCPRTPPLPHLWLRRLSHRLPIFSQQGHRFSIINAHFHHCLGCLGGQRLPSLTLPSLSRVSAFIFAEGCFPHSLLTGHRKHASLVRCW